MVPVVRLVLDHMRSRSDRRDIVLRLTAVEIAVAPARSAFYRSGVRWSGGRGRHELAASIERVATQARRMVFEAIFVGDHHGSDGYAVVVVVVVVAEVMGRVVAFEDAVAEGEGLGGLDPGRSLAVRFRGFCTRGGVGGGGGDGRGYIHLSNI